MTGNRKMIMSKRIQGILGMGLAFALLAGSGCTEVEREDACGALSASDRRSEIESCKSGIQHAEIIHRSNGNLSQVLQALTDNGEGTTRTCLEGRLRSLGASVTGTQILHEFCWCQYNDLGRLFDALEDPDSPRTFDRETIRTEMVTSCQNGGDAYLQRFVPATTSRGGSGGSGGAGGMDGGARGAGGVSSPEPGECIRGPGGMTRCY
jgi:hypothetical protein